MSTHQARQIYPIIESILRRKIGFSPMPMSFHLIPISAFPTFNTIPLFSTPIVVSHDNTVGHLMSLFHPARHSPQLYRPVTITMPLSLRSLITHLKCIHIPPSPQLIPRSTFSSPAQTNHRRIITINIKYPTTTTTTTTPSKTSNRV